MPREDREIKVFPPQKEEGKQRDALQQRRLATPKPINIWAYRMDRGGQDNEYADTRQGEWESRFETPWSPVIANMDSTWTLTDDEENDYEIEAVVVPPKPRMRRRKLWIYAKTHTR